MEDARAQTLHSTFTDGTSAIIEVKAPPVAQPQHPPNDPAPNEEQLLAQTQQLPNDHVPPVNEEAPRIDPKLLRAIVDEDLTALKKILGIELEASTNLVWPFWAKKIWKIAEMIALFYLNLFAKRKAQIMLDKLIWFKIKILRKGPVEQNGNAIPATEPEPDPEAVLHSSNDINNAPINTEQNGLRGVTYGRNNALHIVAGVMESLPLRFSLGTKIILLVSLGNIAIFFIIPFLLIALLNMGKDLEIAEIIYRKDPTLLRARNHAMETPLLCAAKAGKHRMVTLFIKLTREGNPQKLEEVLCARNQLGETALHEAAHSDYSFVVEELVGADETLANLLDNNGTSPLYMAAASGSLDVVRVLIGCKPPVSHSGPHGQTALHAAIIRGEGYKGRSIIQKILDWKPALATTTDEAQNTPLHYAASIGNSYAVRKMLSKNPDAVYKPNSSGSFPVHLAAEAGSFRVINEIQKKCPDVGELLDQKQRNFLHIAVEKGRLGLVTLAFMKGILNANMINARDKNGNTPLHLAVKSSDSETVTLLFWDNRVNPNIRNEAGLTPLDISTSLQDSQFTYSLNPQSIIHHALLTRGAFQNPSQPDLSEIANNLVKNDNEVRADCPSRKEDEETSNAIGIDIEKESIKYENMSKSLITGAVLIASAAFAAIFTVSGVYRDDDDTSHTLIKRRNVFKAFIIADMLAFIFAVISTTWLLYSALTNLHLKYRKFYFRRCTLLLYGAINLFILTFGLGGYIAIVPLCEWLALLIVVVSGVAVLWNLIWNPKFVPLILLSPYIITEPQ